MATVEAPVILFDGVCNLCNAAVQFILKYEKKPFFKFGTLQSTDVQELLSKFSSQKISDSVLLIENGELYQESTAALLIARKLRYFWVFYYFIFIPRWLRDPIYRFIAKNRYKLFGKRDRCMIPTEDLKHRFI